MIFAQPLWLLLLPALPWLIWRQMRLADPALRMPQWPVGGLGASWRTAVRRWLPWLRWIALAALVVAMARPQRRWQEQKITAEALDILLAMDISPSMLSKDFDPDRLAVAKNVAADFVARRPHDRLGLVAFSAEAFTQCPLTTDGRVVQQFIRELQVGRLADGTAIGMGLATAVNRLKDSATRSRIVILLTDGENNAGYLSPEQAAELAKTLGIRVYTIGIGTEGLVLSPSSRNFDGTYEFDFRPADFNTELLEKIASDTGGRFYRARSSEDLSGIYAEIDRLEKTPVETTVIRRTADWFGWLIAFGLLLLAIEAVLRWALLRAVTI